VGDQVHVAVDVLRDGHEVLRAEGLVWAPEADAATVITLHHLDAASLGVRWGGTFAADRPGVWRWDVRAWADPLASWRVELSRKAQAGQADLGSELAEGAVLLAACADRAAHDDTHAARLVAEAVNRAASVVGDPSVDQGLRVTTALDRDLALVCDQHPDRSRAATLPAPVALDVDRVLARFGSWYELFPRSWGGFAGVRRRLPALAELGFDVVYLPPVSPIGLTKRKGRNNALVAGPRDPGSPWAIGDASGGHDAVHPDLGTVADFEALVADARALGMDIALDLAVQCSADHPWLTEHPEWFAHRPDGTLKYAENPPKRYEDIYNLDFDCADWAGLWTALRDVVLTWVARGVRVFRVDNPHTKPLPFWAWLIAGVRATHPDVVFLAEAFTYRAMQQELGRIGFAQGYTYFTWKQTAPELRAYVEELSGPEHELFRPNFFVNTPDILTEQLQHGGEAVFASRLVLAATLSPSYGVYSGFEAFERVAVQPGSEEYLDSEKYEARPRTLDGPLLPLVAQLNAVRRRRPALQHLAGIRFLETENTQLLAYAKPPPDRPGDPPRAVGGGVGTVLMVVLLDPHTAHEGVCIVPDDLGLPPTFHVVDDLTGARYTWHRGRNYVRLEPGARPAHILAVVGP
jgi:starch synthase (maltosyl-transferring)